MTDERKLHEVEIEKYQSHIDEARSQFADAVCSFDRHVCANIFVDETKARRDCEFV